MANVLDFTCDSYPDNLLKSIFEHQHELAVKYVQIEVNNGLCHYSKMPVEIDDAKAQARIKDMTWRAVEEVAEAMEALGKGEILHFYEELADGLHFVVEKMLLCDMDVDKIPPLEWWMPLVVTPIEEPLILNHSPSYPLANIQKALVDYVVTAGLTCNCLKNKPWKTTQMMTDTRKFNNLVQTEFGAFLMLCNHAGFNPRSLYDMYIRKNQVNQFRQRTNY